MTYYKILSVSGGKIEIQKNTKNPIYEAEFDRLDNMGCFSIDEICKKLDDMGIDSENSSIEYASLPSITFKKLFYIMDGMKTKDLILLSGKIIQNDIVTTLIDKIISSRNKGMGSPNLSTNWLYNIKTK